MRIATACSSIPVLLILSCGGEKTAATAPDAASAPPAEPYCRAAHKATIQIGESVRISPDPGLGAAEVSWRGDLNGDELADFVLRFPEACGNYGDCPHGVFVSCEAGDFGQVWEPEYAIDLTPREASSGLEPGERGWLPLRELRRDEDPPHERLLRFDGERYRPVPPGVERF